MELKQELAWIILNFNTKRLNRTFYGIETNDHNRQQNRTTSLNRTFYGIETQGHPKNYWLLVVLIVPFMELKLRYIIFNNVFYAHVLIVPFMELKQTRGRQTEEDIKS